MTMVELLARISRVLLDETKVRWPEAELVSWVNEGAIEIVILDPSANPSTTDVEMASGTQQALPSDLLSMGRFLAVIDGSVVWPAPLATSHEHLDMLVPGWRGMAGVPPGEIDLVVYNPNNRHVCDVFPPSDGNGSLKVLYGKKPTVVTASDAAPLPDQYCSALTDYALYRAFSKDDPASEDSSADKAYQRFLAHFSA